MKNQKHKRPRYECLPKICIAVFILTAISALLYFIATQSSTFAGFFNTYPAAFFRRCLAYLTNKIPFSLGEATLLCLPAILILLIVYAFRHHNQSWRSAFVYFGKLASVVCLVLSVYLLNFGIGYYTPTLDVQLGLADEKVSAEELRQTALLLADHIAQEAESIGFREQNFSVMPYDKVEMNQKLLAAYDAFIEKSGITFIQNYESRVKRVMLSEPMSYTHITGVYTFFTGEANINVNFPDYTLPYTAAHEMAHQRGISRENEANMIAYLVCIHSDDAYIRYSGYLNMYEYVSNALYSASRNAYSEVRATLPQTVRYEMSAYSAFYEKYRENKAATVSNAVNNTFVQVNGDSAGTKSYGLVVDLTVAYYKNLGLVSGE